MRSRLIDFYFFIISLLLLLVDIISIYLNIIDYKSVIDIITIAADIVVIIVFLIAYVSYFVKRKLFRILIASSFTAYMLVIFIISAYYYILPIIGLVLGIVLFYFSEAGKKEKLFYTIVCVLLHTVIMLLQSTGIMPIFEFEVETGVVYNLVIVTMLNCLLIGAAVVFYIFSMRSQKKINLALLFQRKKRENKSTDM